MTKPVLAIGIDAGDPVLIDRMIATGQLPTLQSLRRRGASGQVVGLPFYRAEAAWTMFLTGVSPARTSYWSPLKYRTDYRVDHIGAYDFAGVPPFYAHLSGVRVGAFDLPQTRVVAGVDGVQVVAWGAHSPLTASASAPADVLPQILQRHGTHPTLESDEAPVFNRAALVDLRTRLLAGLDRRAAATIDVLRRGPWDLFLTMISETHAAGHYLWHLSDATHPLHAALHRDGDDPVGDVLRAADRTIGAIIAAAPPDASVVVFSVHGMEANSMDLPSMVFLPELLFRHSHPGRRGVRGLDHVAPLPPVQTALHRSCWEDELYALKHDANPLTRQLRAHVPSQWFYRIERKLGLNGVPVCYRECDTLHYQPAWWYQRAWPTMRAFALPSFSEGYVRINLQGREQSGVVAAEDYDSVCDELTAVIQTMRDARNGRPLVRAVRRTRKHGNESDSSVPDPDLIVSWAPFPTDVVDTVHGRIGPVPYLRTGSHVERGFVTVVAPGVRAGSTLPSGSSLDLPPTILTLLGVPLPPRLEGRSLVSASDLAVA